MTVKLLFLFLVISSCSHLGEVDEKETDNQWKTVQDNGVVVHYSKIAEKDITNFVALNSKDTVAFGFTKHLGDLEVKVENRISEGLQIIALMDTNNYGRESLEELWIPSGGGSPYLECALLTKQRDSLYIYPRFHPDLDSIALEFPKGEFTVMSISKSKGFFVVPNSALEGPDPFVIWVFKERIWSKDDSFAFSGFFVRLTESRLAFSWLEFLKNEMKFDDDFIESLLYLPDN